MFFIRANINWKLRQARPNVTEWTRSRACRQPPLMFWNTDTSADQLTERNDVLKSLSIVTIMSHLFNSEAPRWGESIKMLSCREWSKAGPILASLSLLCLRPVALARPNHTISLNNRGREHYKDISLPTSHLTPDVLRCTAIRRNSKSYPLMTLCYLK